MQLVQSNDRANRLSFKGALQHKVEAALTAPAPEPEAAAQLLLLPTNFEDLSETDLHFSLLHNKELRHSRESANLAVEIVFNKRLHPKNVTFQTIDLKNPVKIPQFAKKAEPKRSPARQIVAPDSTAVRMQAEKDKEAEFKAYIENLSTRTFNNEAVFNEPTPMVLRVPKNYNDFSESELFHVLTHTTELEHSRHTAYLAMDILSGKISKPQNVTLQSIVLPQVVVKTPAPVKIREIVANHVIEAERDKREQFKAKLADKANVVPTIEPLYVPETIELRLPSHYEELSEAGLFYSLTHNPELQHSHDSATLAVEIIFNKIAKPESVNFQTVDLTDSVALPVSMEVKTTSDPLDGFIPEREMSKRAELKQYLAQQTDRILASSVVVDEEPVVLKVPKNYKELSQDEILYLLLNSTDLGHNRESAYRTMDILSGKLAKPQNVTLQAKTLTKPVAAPKVQLTPAKKIVNAIHPDIQANEDAKYEAYLASQTESKTPVVSEKELVLRVPTNFKEMSGAELLSAITSNTAYGHTSETAYLTIDIVSGRVPRPENVKLLAETLALAQASTNKPVVLSTPKEVVTSIHPDILANENAKRDAYNHYLANKRENVPTVVVEKELVLRVPFNYKDISNAELLATITNNLEYGHTHYTAYLALDILSGRIAKPDNVVLKAVKFAEKVITASAPVKTETVPLPEIVIEREREKREDFKHYLANKASRVAETPVIDSTPVVLRVPMNYKELSERDLLFTLMNHTEFEHSRDSAYRTADIISGAIAQPENVVLKVTMLNEPIVVEKASPVKEVYTPSAGIVESERFKREAFKHYLAGKAARTAEVPIEETSKIILRVPSNYAELNATELLYVLMNNAELAQTRESAYNTIDILFGAIPKPQNITLQAVNLDKPAPTPVITPRAAISEKSSLVIHPELKAADNPKRQLFKQELADRAKTALASKPIVEVEKTLKTVLLPEGYESMSSGELHFALVRNPELQHSQESARYAVDVLSGKIKNSSVKFETVALSNPQLAPVMPATPAKEKIVKAATPGKYVINRPALLAKDKIPLGTEGVVIKIPHNYEDLSETQLHFALSHNREYGHSYESTYEALDILYGRTECPKGTVFSLVEVKNPVERAY